MSILFCSVRFICYLFTISVVKRKVVHERNIMLFQWTNLHLQKLADTDLEDIWTRIQRNLIKPSTGIPSWMDAVEEGNAVYLFDISFAKYFIGERFRKTGKCGIGVTAIDMCSGYIGFPTRKGMSKRLLTKFNDA